MSSQMPFVTVSQASEMPLVREARASAPTFRAVFDAHGPWVWTTLRRLGVAERDVEDVTHDTFVRIAAHLDEYDPGRPIRAWLFVFALRMARDYRRLARHRHERIGAASEDVVLDAPDPEEMLEARETHAIVTEALESLDWDKRDVFVACELEELPVSEVAASLGISRNTAASRLRLARAEFTKAVRRIATRRQR